MFRHYLRLIIFSVGLLSGIQIPALIDQYVKRVDAQLIEAEAGLSGFQTTADRYFNGSLPELISHYRQSEDNVFKEDADNIARLYDRQVLLHEHFRQLQSSLPTQIWTLLVDSDRQIMQRTLEAYSYVVLLSPEAIIVGFICAMLLALLFDILSVLCGSLFGFGRSRRRQIT